MLSAEGMCTCALARHLGASLSLYHQDYFVQALVSSVALPPGTLYAGTEVMLACEFAHAVLLC
jgi:hypothetical protein